MVIPSLIVLFCYLGTHFLEIESDGKECKVHVDLVFAEVAEPFISHVVFHLTENSLGLYAPSSPVL